jgi:myosin heavy subunit
LVAVNPFEKLDIYSEKEAKKAAKSMHPYPHVFVTGATGLFNC